MELNNKELALLITITLLFIWGSYKNMDCFTQLLKATFSPKLVKLYFLVLIYFVFITYLFYQTSLWNYSLMKTSIIWILSTGIMTVFSTIEKKEINIRQVVTKSFIISLFVDYIIGFSNYSVIIELLLLWAALLLSLCVAMIQDDGQLQQKPGIDKVEKLIYIILSVIFFNNFINGIFNIIEHKGNELSILELMLPFLYTLAYIPFCYLLAAYVQYETALIRLGYYDIENKFLKFYLVVSLTFILKANTKRIERTQQYPLYKLFAKCKSVKCLNSKLKRLNAITRISKNISNIIQDNHTQ